MKFDELLETIGEFGPYQKRIFVLASLVTVAGGYQVLSVVFLLDIPEYRCAIPGYENDTFAPQSPYHEHLINLSIPLVENAQGEASHSQCKLYNVTSDNPGDNVTQYDCDAWVYDTSSMVNTVMSEFNMVCQNTVFRSVGTMVGFAGGAVGSVVFGVLSDSIGRKKAPLLAVLLNGVDGIVAAFSTSYIFYTVTGFFFGFTASGLFMITLVTGGLFLLNAAAYFIRDWRHLRLTLAIPSVTFIGLWCVNEYVRAFFRRLVQRGGPESQKIHIEGLIPTFSDDFTQFAITLVYFGLSVNVNNLSGDLYFNFFLSSLMELFASGITLFVLYKVGRRPLLILSMMIGGVACLASIFPVLYGNTSTMWTLIALSMVGKLAVSASFSIVDIYSVEVFPTVVRQSSMAVCTIFGSIGGMAAPYIADLGILVGGNLKDALPLIVFGSLSVAAGLSDFILPETRNRKLPETIQDAIDFGKENGKESMDVQEEKPKAGTHDITFTIV